MHTQELSLCSGFLRPGWEGGAGLGEKEAGRDKEPYPSILSGSLLEPPPGVLGESVPSLFETSLCIFLLLATKSSNTCGSLVFLFQTKGVHVREVKLLARALGKWRWEVGLREKPGVWAAIAPAPLTSDTWGTRGE